MIFLFAFNIVHSSSPVQKSLKITISYLLVGLSLKGITPGGGGQKDAHKVHRWGKSMLPVGSYLVREGCLHGDLRGVIARVNLSVGGLARRCAPQRKSPMIVND